MARIEKKRARDEGFSKSRKKQSTGRFKEIFIGKHQSVNLDTLSWSAVDFPENFDDAEGFFGLEEISNVDVVKDPDSGRVEYRTTKQGEDDAGNEDEFHGFAEDPEEALTATLESNSLDAAKRKVRRAISKAAKRRKKDEKQNTGPTASKTVSANSFAALGNVGRETEGMNVSAWKPLQLSSETHLALARLRFARPTPIQKSTIPEIMEGHDVIGKAPTGSGKTLAFGIPIYEHFLKTRQARSVVYEEEPGVNPTALIISPTRELAHQLTNHLMELCSHASLFTPKIATVTGGLSLHKQQRLLKNADIIIGTPGRLWEIINGSPLTTYYQRIRYLVVDEADRLLSEGHFKDLAEILNVLDRHETKIEHQENGDVEVPLRQQRQTLVFSATFQKDLQEKLAGKSKPTSSNLMSKQESMEYLLKKLNFREDRPKFIDVNPDFQMAQGLREGLIECNGPEKDLYLYALLLHHPQTRILVFTNSITSVRRLAPFLQNLDLPAHALHSEMPQKARLRSLERFSSSSMPHSILIATDVAARGLDIPSVQLVVHYHVPRAADVYVHRSGRTARAEKSGSSILLCAPGEVQGVRRLVAKVHARNTNTNSDEGKTFFMRTIELDRRVVARLKPRVALSKKIADSTLAKEKKGHEDNWLKTAAEDLGVDYDSEEFAAGEGSKKGRGAGRKKEKEARGLTKTELGAMRGQLKDLLAQRVNVGVSERYLTAGGIDVDELLKGGRGEFLGKVDDHMNAL